MCGISGFYGDFDPALLPRMNESQRHRGPDDEGTLFLRDHGLGLAHRRLSIIDLSPAARQPMHDASGALAIVFNGEIYNYRELRAELQGQGCAFRTQSDTEVLLHLYQRDGAQLLSRVNGIFAFAIWDARDASLFLARDHLGVKPLYHAQTPRGFVFASELKAILQDTGIDRTIDPLAIHYHLTYLWAPAPTTMLRGVRKLEPGHAMRVHRDRRVEHWQDDDIPVASAEPAMPLAAAVDKTRALLQQAVRRQMVADVPVGAFLSGGLDSTSVTAFAREAAGHRLPCFTIAFEGAATRHEGMRDDLPYARLAAQQLDVDLHTVTVRPDMVDELPKTIYHLDEPQADLAPINVLMISRLAAASGIKVLLSGAGGDDLFSGYRRHAALRYERCWKWLPRFLRRTAGAAAARLPNYGSFLRRVNRAFRHAGGTDRERLVGYFAWCDRPALSRLYGPTLRPVLESRDPAAPLLATLDRLPSSVTPLNRMLYLEGKHFLPDHNLGYTDKMGMAAGVEVRVPFLDLDLVAFAASLPEGYKQNGRTGKKVLRLAMADRLPSSILHRSKTGFGAPLRQWLRKPLAPLLHEVLSEASLRKRGLFESSAVARLIAADRARHVDGSYTLLSLLCIELWCRMFVDKATPSD